MPFEAILANDELRRLRSAFQRHGRDVRLVGGCVRDLLLGETPKDIDLCTDASPDEQAAIYSREGFRYHETGLKHGTLTALVNSRPFEITSLRTESEHDGRRAVVHYTRDWIADLGRRDLTINAMALTLDGVLVDPFGGRRDLERRMVRFVGSPDDRIREDYLRILRFVRFQGRIAPEKTLHAPTVRSIRQLGEGLRGISRERVWSEMGRILSGAAGPRLLRAIRGELELAAHIDLPQAEPRAKLESVHSLTRDPVTIMVAAFGHRVLPVANAWKWSRAETEKAAFLVEGEVGERGDAPLKRLLAVESKPREWVRELACLTGDAGGARMAETWRVPVFPVTGNDLIDLGHAPGRALGAALGALRDAWSRSDYAMSREELLVVEARALHARRDPACARAPTRNREGGKANELG